MSLFGVSARISLPDEVGRRQMHRHQGETPGASESRAWEAQTTGAARKRERADATSPSVPEPFAFRVYVHKTRRAAPRRRRRRRLCLLTNARDRRSLSLSESGTADAPSRPALLADLSRKSSSNLPRSFPKARLPRTNPSPCKFLSPVSVSNKQKIM